MSKSVENKQTKIEKHGLIIRDILCQWLTKFVGHDQISQLIARVNSYFYFYFDNK